MKDNINLYIGGMPVDLSDNVDILFTYAADDLTNPTVVRNSYSKTITIQDTPNNSKVFGHFWQMDRAQGFEDGSYGTNFNPSKRIPFTLYANGEIYQSGYAKLLNVRKSGKNNVYELSLFGGLGSFLFNLAYLDDNNTDNNKRKLSDLHFIPGSISEKEFDFTIKQDTIIDAWNNVNTADESNMWHYINFADCYDGVPSDFNADKVLMYFGTSAVTASTETTPSYPNTRPGGGSQSNPIPTYSSTTDGNYATYDGYALAQLPKNKTAQEMREYRSYLLRPVLRVKDVINACCDPDNNGGFEVDLDSTFFCDSNPYWEKAWMTLSPLSSMDFHGVEGDEQTGVTASLGTTVTGGTKNGENYEEKTEIVLGTISANTYFNFETDLDISVLMNSLPSGYNTTTPIYPCAYSQNTNTYYPGAIEVQLVAYSLDGKVITGSDVINCTSSYGQRRTSSRLGRETGQSYFPTPNDLNFTPAYNSQYVTKSVWFNHTSGSTWNMNQTLHLSLKKVPKTATIKLVVNKINVASDRYYATNKSMLLFQRYTDSSVTKYRTGAVMNHFTYTISNVEVSLMSGEGIRTGARFTKSDLLNTDYTPADFFLSYCKLFGLYIEKDKYEDKIYVRTRDTFYRKENVIDLSDRIDHSKDINITPTVFDSKWYDWSLELKDGLFAEDYYDTYGVPYEIQRCNTGYNFDASEKDLYKDNLFKGAVECLEKSDMFGFITGSTVNQPWMYNGFTYDLYSTEDLSNTVDVEVKPMTKKGVIMSYSDNSQYDLFTKMQFHGEDQNAADGSNVLCFFAGYVPTKTINTGEDLSYYVTDDNAYMSVLNDNTACWLYTNSELDSLQTRIATKITQIPHFTRYIVQAGNIVTSWGFGVPHQLYIPEYSIDYPATLYDKYWRSYIKDMYDIDSKKLSCFVKLDQRPTEEWLRDFYWFDNSVWRINKINEANVKNLATTNIEFIKVQDRYAYTNAITTDVPSISLSASTYNVSNSGATVTIYVTETEGLRWYVSDSTYINYSASTSSGLGNGTFTITIPANGNNTSLIHYISVENAMDEWATLQINQGDTEFIVRAFGPHSNGDIPWTGGTQMYDVFSTYPWTATNVDNRTYVVMDPISGTGGTYANHFEVTFEPTDSLAPRNVKMRFTNSIGNVVDVWKWQDKMGDLTFPSSGGTKTIYYPSGATMTYPSWVNVTDNGDGTYTITARANTEGYSRTNVISLNGDSLNVIQGSETIFSVTRTDGSGDIVQSGGTAVLRVDSSTGWTATTSDNYISLGTTASTASAVITVTFQNNTGASRTATLTFINDLGNTVTYTLTQAGTGGGQGLVSPNLLMFDATGGTKTLNINIPNDWMVASKPDWISTESSGSGISTITVTAPPYSGNLNRQASMVVADMNTNIGYLVTCIQNAADGEMLAVSPSQLRFASTGGTATMTIISNTDWTIA